MSQKSSVSVLLDRCRGESKKLAARVALLERTKRGLQASYISACSQIETLKAERDLWIANAADAGDKMEALESCLKTADYTKEEEPMKIDRVSHNRKLIAMLTQLVNAYPDLRFSQLLINFDFVKTGQDEYNLESSVLCDRVAAAKKKIMEQF